MSYEWCWKHDFGIRRLTIISSLSSKKMSEIKCDICGNLFFTKHAAKRCSTECNKQYRSIANAKYHKKNKTVVNARAKERYVDNPQWFRERDKKRWEKKRRKREIAEEKIIRNTNDTNVLSEDEKEAKIKAEREQTNRTKRQNYHSDKVYALKNRIRSLVNNKLRDRDFTKSQTTEQYLGCDIETLMKHLEKNFKDGMSWDNRENWHIDHLVPISRASTEEDFILLSHYTNLQPLWADDNIGKSNKLGFHNVTGKLVKKFGLRGEYQQYRYEKVVDFECHMCRKDKTAKLVVVYDDDWSKIICNGCYGRELSKR
jgi:hypothetical protein